MSVQTEIISTHAPAGGATVHNTDGGLCRADFYSRPCGRGDPFPPLHWCLRRGFLLTPLREGRRVADIVTPHHCEFLLTPLREGRPYARAAGRYDAHFYSRPCGRGDAIVRNIDCPIQHFYSRPCGRGDCVSPPGWLLASNFYSRPCGRGDLQMKKGLSIRCFLFLLTPLREGRRTTGTWPGAPGSFLLTPLREGRPHLPADRADRVNNFYSRPCGRGDRRIFDVAAKELGISTHAPAGGATYPRKSWARRSASYFYSRPCGRGDAKPFAIAMLVPLFLLTPLREGRRRDDRRGVPV